MSLWCIWALVNTGLILVFHSSDIMCWCSLAFWQVNEGNVKIWGWRSLSWDIFCFLVVLHISLNFSNLKNDLRHSRDWKKTVNVVRYEEDSMRKKAYDTNITNWFFALLLFMLKAVINHQVIYLTLVLSSFYQLPGFFSCTAFLNTGLLAHCVKITTR